MNEIDLRDSRHILPGGYDAHRITEPPAIPAEALAAYELAEAHEELGLTRALHAAGALDDGDTQAMLATVSGKLGRALRLLTGGALVLALAVLGLVAGPSAGRAEAMEGPQPDPVAAVSVGVRTVPVTLSSAVVTARIPVATTHVTPAGWHCAAVFSARLGFVGRACSPFPSYTVAVRLDARAVPVGRSTLTVVDDVSPFDGLPATVTLVARRPSRFGTGTWTDLGSGQLYVSAPVLMYSPAAGYWLPQNLAPVRVQVYGSAGWRTVATLTSNQYGIAAGIMTTGGGVFRMRVVRPQGATVTATTGTTRTVGVTTEPLDVI